ncbi:hypothetical protein WP4W18E05_23120 [Klebsiella sp. WP4-W18-ESBL-05]|nr:hypothetical protein WP4W18E05_23120 [Klebsiella sp. WP4-W18-ESBL-05]
MLSMPNLNPLPPVAVLTASAVGVRGVREKLPADVSYFVSGFPALGSHSPPARPVDHLPPPAAGGNINQPPPPASRRDGGGSSPEIPLVVPSTAARATFCASFFTVSANGVRLTRFAPDAVIAATAAAVAAVGAADVLRGAYGLAGLRLLTRLMAASS